ncbi:MAG TPA: PBSX family phage terminase large subunit [Candidatus Gemmiger excrementigallinarum]|uniref:PBSX family phage terminase large subunit n=1 Tax=Candidatus Gemmiger excrementigallinarum TaxID=2838609 RepID=A0A9D2ERP9_9FIRM|nr:PBSX family phage terminase large subunit [Candidatus Gemmiger excrementigallinarum]
MTCKLSELISPAFFEVHRQIKAGKVTELLAKGGRGSTKSSYISLELILQLLLHPQCHVIVLRKVDKTLRTSVYAQICWAIAALGLGSRFKCTVSPMECTYRPTGQKILFFGMDDPGKLKSLKVPFGYIGLLWFEELDQFDGPEQVRNVEQSCLRGGPYALTFKSFNPPASARSWANRYALEQRPGKLVHHSTYQTTPAQWLGPRFLADAEHLQATNPVAYRHEYGGEVVGSGTAVFENLRLEAIPDDLRAGFDRPLHGVDWGWYPDPWAYNAVHYDAARRTLYILDELTRRRTSNRDTATLLQQRGLTGADLITADSAEPKSVGDYRAFGLACKAAQKGPGSVNYSMKWLQGLDAIVIDPAVCPDTAREFSEYEYERDARTGEVLPGYPDLNNHHIDAVRYATECIWKRKGT